MEDLKKSDSCGEEIDTYTTCPYCFQGIQLTDNEHHHEDEIATCPLCGNDFRLGEVQ